MMVGMDADGAPLSLKFWSLGSCESTVIKMVGGTPAHL